MVCMIPRWSLIPLCFSGAFATLALAVAADGPDFDKQVAPILAKRCLECHSGADPKAKLDLSRAETALAGGESGIAIVRGKPDESYLWQQIDAEEMPPKHPLPADERAVLKDWIRTGARWGTDPIDPFRITTAARAGYDWWSLQGIVKPQLPEVKDGRWAKNDIDRFVLARLEAANLTPSAPADRRMLLRRVYFDLTGLPPSPEALGGNVEYSQVIDDLLASPHYGERWARHWLDVAHFGESDGFEFDRMRPYAWRYRDWVIDSFNRDLPYDEFARLQIAGDVLRPGDDSTLIATGFLVGGAHDSLLPKGEVMQKIMRQDELEDLVGLVSQTFLGLTVHCARCHDHKFDPVRQTDYYRLAAALAGVKRANRDIPAAPPGELLAAQQQAATELAQIAAAARAAVLVRRRASAKDPPQLPDPVVHWEFDGTPNDESGSLPGALHGAARIEGGALILDGKDGYAATAPLARDLTEKTLEAWVQLRGLEQRGGGVIGIESLDGKTFDTIVFGEREPRRWIAGSNNFERTKSIEGAEDEAAAKDRSVHVAAVYHADGRIQLYRDGQPYGKPYASVGPVKFVAGKSRVVFGLRHSPPGGNKLLAGRIERARLYDRALSPEEVAASAAALDSGVREAEILAELDEAGRARYKALQLEVARLHARLQEYIDRKTFAVSPQAAPIVNLLVRGNVQQPGEVVPPDGIACLAAQEAEFGLAADAPDAERRTKLANWIANQHNPLFARTIVNRIWQYHFGRGLVEASSDLGFSGGQASHPELLDWLATELIEHRWSLKDLHRLIVSSATYQQASHPRGECEAVDADNRLLWRYSPRRLEAECVRDAMLACAAQLNPQMGGPSFMDFRPFVYKSTQYYEPLDPIGPEFQRRSIYRFGARGGRNPLLDTFDCPDPSTTAPRRASTTTPLQALALFNNSFTLRMADHFAERLRSERPQNATQQISRAFEIAYGRLPAEAELKESLAFTKEHGLEALCRVLFNSNGSLYVH